MSRWRPTPGTTWQWQLTGRLDLTVDAAVYDIDGFTTSAADVAALHRKGRRVICYLNLGAVEDFRQDRGRFPSDVVGKPLGWPGEHWLDIRRVRTLGPIIATRLDMCRAKGFDGVEPDNIDGYANDTGFPLTAADQLRFNRYLADQAHRRGLSIGLKNDLPQIPELVGQFDFAIDEQCVQYDECDSLLPFIKADKAVFHAEYEVSVERMCATTKHLRLSSIRKSLELTAPRTAC